MRLVCKVLCVLVAWTCLALAACANNTFPGTVISGATGTLSGISNTTATGETGEPVTYGGGNLNTMWYTWTAPGNGVVTFETCGATQTTFDTTLQSFTGVAVNALTLLATNDDTTGCPVSVNANYGSRITFNVTAGLSYKVQVDGYNNATGTFRLVWSFTGFNIAKTASLATISAPGTITYTIAVANAGAAALNGLTITDALMLGVSARTLTSGPTLTSGDTNANGQIDTTETFNYTATYAVPQSDIDLGGVYSNTATFDTAQTVAHTSAAATTTIIQSPSFSNVKAQSAGPSPVTAAGQTITYSITIDNTGNVTLNGLSFTDTFLLGAAPRTLTSGPTLTSGDTDSDGAIDATEIWVYNATYLTTQADFDATGNFSNVLSFDTAQTAPVVSNTVTTNVGRAPNLTILKAWTFAAPGDDINSNGVADLNDFITYTYSVTNTGNVTITGISVSDVHTGYGTLSAISPVSVPSLAPSSNAVFMATYATVQGDIDNP